MANKNAFDLATLVYQAAIIAPGKALVTKPANGTGDLSFSRAGSADRIDAEGNTETMGPNTLRIDYRFSLDGSNTCPVALVTADDSETLSISNLVANGFTFDNCTVFYLDNFQRVVKVYTSDGNCKAFIDGEEIGTTVEARPDSLSFPIGDYSALQQLLIIKAALVDSDALALSRNSLLDTYTQAYLSAYVQLLVEGYSIESAARTLNFGSTVNALFAQGFTTFLAPGAGKPGRLSFIKYEEDTAGNPALPGTLLEAEFSRPDIGATSGATVLNSAGYLVELGEDVPDNGYPLEGGYPRLLMRPQRSNLVPISVGDIGAWSEFKVLGGSVTFNVNQGLSPDGTFNAFAVKEVDSTGNHNWYIDNLTVEDATVYTLSFYVKSIGGRNIRIDEGGLGFNVEGIIDLSNGSVLSSSFGNIEVVNAGGGWYRVVATGTTSGTSQRLIFNATSGTSLVYTGDPSKGVLLYGLQYEKGSSVTSLIPTTGSVVTRSSNQYLLNLNTLLATNEVSFFLEVVFRVSQQDLFRFGDGSNNNLVAVGVDNQKLKVGYRVLGGSYSSTGFGSATIPLNELVKIAGVITPSGVKLSYAGSIDLDAAIDLSLLPLIDSLKSAAIFDTLFPYELHSLALVPGVLSDEQLNAATL